MYLCTLLYTLQFIVKQNYIEALLLCQISTNVMKPMTVIRHRRRASMNQEPTAVAVYPDSTVLLVARLATVTTEICRRLLYIYRNKGKTFSDTTSHVLNFVQVFLQFYLQMHL